MRTRVLAAALPAVVTAALLPWRDDAPLAVVLPFYLLLVVGAAVAGGLGAGLAAAAVSFVATNWFLTEPFGTWRISGGTAVAQLVVFVVVAVAVSVVVEAGSRARAAEIRLRADAAALEETERVRATLLAAVGHDLRTPLAGIKAAVSGLLARDVTWTDADRRELAASIDASADRMTSLVENLLALSRLEAGVASVRLAPVSLLEVASRVLVDRPDVALDVAETLPWVVADDVLLERVLANLVDNAVRHGAAPVVVAAREVGAHVVVDVVDHGRGLAGADVWQPRTDGRLGLTIVRRFLEAMGTSAASRPTPGGGATVTFRLAVAP